MFITKGNIVEKKIELQTSLGNDIPNLQKSEESSLLMQKQLSTLKTKYIGVKFKSGPSSLYNCHGMTFANRRTGIYEIESINSILVDDKYIEVKIGEISPGDIVLYFSENGDIEHSGIVSSITLGDINDIKIISKWGVAYETIHSLYNCPYEKRFIRFYRCQL